MKKDLNSGDPHALMMVGGQAVIEGVMMRAQGRIATAVRRADGTIVVRREEFVPIGKRYPVLAAPILRGAVGHHRNADDRDPHAEFLGRDRHGR